MTLEKAKRMAAAVTASAVLLLCMLIAVMLFQISSIHGKAEKRKELDAKIAELQMEKGKYEEEIDRWLRKWKIEEYARERGYIYPDDKTGG